MSRPKGVRGWWFPSILNEEEKEVYEEKQKEVESVANPIMTKMYQTMGGEGGMPGGMPGGMGGGGVPDGVPGDGMAGGGVPDGVSGPGPKIEEVD